jgi:hypothetical protein
MVIGWVKIMNPTEIHRVEYIQPTACNLLLLALCKNCYNGFLMWNLRGNPPHVTNTGDLVMHGISLFNRADITKNQLKLGNAKCIPVSYRGSFNGSIFSFFTWLIFIIIIIVFFYCYGPSVVDQITLSW